MIHNTDKRNNRLALILLAVCTAGLLAGCGGKHEAIETTPAAEQRIAIVSETFPESGMEAGEVLVEEPVPEETEPVPEYMRAGLKHSRVADLQARLMELGFMDNDEPTEYFGTVTETAVKAFQRQNDLDLDGIVGTATWEAIMDPDARYYAVSNGDKGEDIKPIQHRLYELGYLATADLVTGNFGDKTEDAVRQLQQINGIAVDGKVGRQTANLLYSDEVKPNMLVYGDKSEVVEEAQKRLKTLGYLTTEPDGSYGQDTAIALKQFQSRNDLVVDGYLGPSTRAALNSSFAVPNGLSLGDRGDSVQQVQKLLNKYGYLSSGHVTGYFGEMTEAAVKNFQRTNSLSADGSVGRQTMAKLTGDDVRRAVSASVAGNSSGSSSGGSGNNSGSVAAAGGSSGTVSAPAAGNSSGPGSSGSVAASGGVANLISIASTKLGRPYVYGAKGPNSFDCSGFVYWCLNQAGVRQSYLTSSGWRSVGKYTKISSFDSLQPGDIIVVRGHVGIVAGGGTVIDASSSNGKVVHRSLSSWWRNNFICGWRIFG